MRLVWTAEAAGDLDEIWDYSAQTWGLDQADFYVSQLRSSAATLAKGSVSGSAASDVKFGLRRRVVRSHVIWFRIVGTELRVVRVLHQSRDAGVELP